jgi:hypothetical protein
VIDLASYRFDTGGTTTGLVTFQELCGDGVWRNLVAPAAVTLGAALQYNGILNGPFHGLRLVVSALAVSVITFAELKGSIRSM